MHCLYVIPRGSATVPGRTEAGTDGFPKKLLIWPFSLLFTPKLSQKKRLAVPTL